MDVAEQEEQLRVDAAPELSCPTFWGETSRDLVLQCSPWVILPQHFGSMKPNVTTAFCGSGTLGLGGWFCPLLSRCFERHSRSVSQARQALHKGTFCGFEEASGVRWLFC